MLGAVTKTITPAVMFFEITGETCNEVSVLVGVLMSNFLASKMSMSLIDVLLEFKQYPYLPSLGQKDIYKKTANDISTKEFVYITTESNLSHIQ